MSPSPRPAPAAPPPPGLQSTDLLQLLGLAGEAARRDSARPWLLNALDGLVARQSEPFDAQARPPLDAAALRAGLSDFVSGYAHGHRGLAPDARLQAALDASFTRLVDGLLAGPRGTVHPGLGPADLLCLPDARVVLRDGVTAAMGPLAHDIAALVRHPALCADEAFTIDLSVRYWERARAAGLPVEADFGAFYRDVEWMGLQQQLAALGRWAQHATSTGTAPDDALREARARLAHATAARYVELRPIQRLLERCEALALPTGFVMGRG